MRKHFQIAKLQNLFCYINLPEITKLRLNYWKHKFKYFLKKEPSETTSLEYIKTTN